MSIDKALITGNTTMLILKLLEDRDMYGYQMSEELANRSDNTFSLKAGTLYPILHGLEKDGMVSSYDDSVDSARTRKYYQLTSKGRKLLSDKHKEWSTYTNAVNRVLHGGISYGTI